MDLWRDFAGPNAGYVLDLLDRYRRDPNTVDLATRALFDGWTPVVPSEPGEAGFEAAKIAGVLNLAQAIRAYGHRGAQLDPLGSPPPGDPTLSAAAHGVTAENLQQLPASLIGGPICERSATAADAIECLTDVYLSTTGHDYGHIHEPEERDWLRHAAESCRYCPPNDPIDPTGLLERLTQVEAFERFLHRTFPGKTRFSIEGLDLLIPMLDEIICAAAGAGSRNILLGMAHRGRLNVLAHILNKPYAQIFAEFKDPVRPQSLTDQQEMGWTGDVKYHLGARRALSTGGSRPAALTITLPPNPSHVEAIAPVVQGMARAAGTHAGARGAPRFDPTVTLPIVIHGDAAFPGQGVVAETLNLSRLSGYQTGGTIHIITNNQLGYTTEPGDVRSTVYASDLAKGFEIPIVHVNADDPIACIVAARLAFAYRKAFGKDFLIDLVGYRRYGHNEGDEPSYTQPLMVQRIAQHPSVRALWGASLVQDARMEYQTPEALETQHMESLQTVFDSVQPESDLAEQQPEVPPAGAAQRVTTVVSAERLRALHKSLLTTPAGFTLNSKLERVMGRHRTALEDPDEQSIDWGMAERLAFASILADGVPIRMTGEDVERGTFSHRHAVFHDANSGRTVTPLQTLAQANAAFAIYNSPLTENATLAFEYGYSIQAANHLVVWEAQYGDFINNAQVVVDEFITSARAKWGQTPSLVLLLPHGVEGQGPDHSSARLERFLGLAAGTNVRIANPTTAAQYFHLLRRQAALLNTDPLPLIVMTPKSLLRHPQAASSLRELAEGHWRPVIPDLQAEAAPEDIQRLILCSGKVWVDLTASEHRPVSPAVAVVRVEQLYRVPAHALSALFEAYPGLQEIVWVQEEPENMGAWPFLEAQLRGLIRGRWPLRYVGRSPSASPADGSTSAFVASQRQLIDQAYQFGKHQKEGL